MAAIVVGAGALGGEPAPLLPHGWGATLGTVAGGVLFGLGATLNDGCTPGTIAKLARGQIGFAATPPGFVAGVWIGTQVDLPLPLEASGPDLRWVLAFAVLVIGSWRLIRWRHPPENRPWIAWRASWSVDAAMLIIGLAAGVPLLLRQGWSYLDVLRALAIDQTTPSGGEIVLVVALLGGAFLAAGVAGQIRWTVPTMRRWILHAAGGLLMGLGARLLPGGNDALILSGLPFLFLHAWVGFVAMILTIVASLEVARLIQST